MNGIDKIIERIRADADNEIAELNARTDERVAEISEGFTALSEGEKSEALERGRKAAGERRERLGGVAQLEAKKLVLQSKQEVIDLAFNRALDRLTELPLEDYVNLIAKLAAEASTTCDEEIILSPADRSRCGEAAVEAANQLLKSKGKSAKLKLSDSTRQMRGGCFLRSGKIETNCSFETIIRLMREQMAAEVAAVLFD